MKDNKKHGEALKKYVDEGAVQWKIGSVEKLCSVLAAKHFISKYRENPIAASMRDVVDGLAMSKDHLSNLGVSPPVEFNFMFHLKTGETFLWFGEKNDLTWDQLLAAIDYIEAAYEKQVIKRFGK